MRGNPINRPASIHPYLRSGPVSDVPRIGRFLSVAEQRPEYDADGEWLLPQSPSLQAMDELATELAELLGKRQEPGPVRLPSSGLQLASAQDAGHWRDQLLAEIEDLTGELKGRVARYASLRAVQASGGAAARADAAAVAWMRQTLEDIAATALGLEIASRELFLTAGMAEEQNVNAAQGQKAGTVE